MKRFVRVFPLDPAFYDPGQRIKIERFEGEQNCYLEEEIVWPEKVNDPNAQHIRETLESFCLTPEHQRWLYEALGEMLADCDEDEDEE